MKVRADRRKISVVASFDKFAVGAIRISWYLPLVHRSSLATCCIVVDENCTALFYQRPQLKLQTCLQVFFNATHVIHRQLHLTNVLNKNNYCDEFTCTSCFKRATHRIALCALTIASRFLLGFPAAKMSLPMTLVTSSGMMVTYPLSFIPSSKRPHSSSLQFHTCFLC